MRGIKHPMTDEIYEVSDDGQNVIVTAMLVPASSPLADNGFQVTSKQPTHICGWLGSERGENRFRDTENRTRKMS